MPVRIAGRGGGRQGWSLGSRSRQAGTTPLRRASPAARSACTWGPGPGKPGPPRFAGQARRRAPLAPGVPVPASRDHPASPGKPGGALRLHLGSRLAIFPGLVDSAPHAGAPRLGHLGAGARRLHVEEPLHRAQPAGPGHRSGGPDLGAPGEPQRLLHGGARRDPLLPHRAARPGPPGGPGGEAREPGAPGDPPPAPPHRGGRASREEPDLIHAHSSILCGIPGPPRPPVSWGSRASTRSAPSGRTRRWTWAKTQVGSPRYTGHPDRRDPARQAGRRGHRHLPRHQAGAGATRPPRGRRPRGPQRRRGRAAYASPWPRIRRWWPKNTASKGKTVVAYIGTFARLRGRAVSWSTPWSS
jgi:hypothetical protein